MLWWGTREVKLIISILRTVEDIGLKFFSGHSLIGGYRLLEVSVVLREQLACGNRNIHYWEVMGMLGQFSPMLTVL